MRRAVIVLAAGCTLAVGCRTPAVGPYPPDPLVIARKPVPATARSAGILAPLAAVEPTPPPIPNDPACAVRSNPPPAEPDPTAVRTVGHRTETPPRAVEYGSDPHLHWLQGTLEKGADGRFELCYRRPSLDAPVGKVRLEDDERLTTCADGDAVRVEGVLVPSLAPPSPDAAASAPRFKISAVSRPPAAP